MLDDEKMGGILNSLKRDKTGGVLSYIIVVILGEMLENVTRAKDPKSEGYY